MKIKSVYVLQQVSKSLPDENLPVIKVGITNDIEQRIQQLSSADNTWDCVYSVKSEQARDVEKLAHKELKEHRMANEFFVCEPQIAIQAVKDALKEMECEKMSVMDHLYYMLKPDFNEFFDKDEWESRELASSIVSIINDTFEKNESVILKIIGHGIYEWSKIQSISELKEHDFNFAIDRLRRKRKLKQVEYVDGYYFFYPPKILDKYNENEDLKKELLAMIDYGIDEVGKINRYINRNIYERHDIAFMILSLLKLDVIRKVSKFQHDYFPEGTTFIRTFKEL